MVGMVEVGVVDLPHQVQLQRKLEVKEMSLQFLEYKVFLAVVDPTLHHHLDLLLAPNMLAVAVVLVKKEMMVQDYFLQEVMEAQLELKVVAEILLLEAVEDLEDLLIAKVELVEEVLAQEMEVQVLVLELRTLVVEVEVATKMAELVVQV